MSKRKYEEPTWQVTFRLNHNILFYSWLTKQTLRFNIDLHKPLVETMLRHTRDEKVQWELKGILYGFIPYHLQGLKTEIYASTFPLFNYNDPSWQIEGFRDMFFFFLQDKITSTPALVPESVTLYELGIGSKSIVQMYPVMFCDWVLYPTPDACFAPYGGQVEDFPVGCGLLSVQKEWRDDANAEIAQNIEREQKVQQKKSKNNHWDGEQHYLRTYLPSDLCSLTVSYLINPIVKDVLTKHTQWDKCSRHDAFYFRSFQGENALDRIRYLSPNETHGMLDVLHQYRGPSQYILKRANVAHHNGGCCYTWDIRIELPSSYFYLYLPFMDDNKKWTLEDWVIWNVVVQELHSWRTYKKIWRLTCVGLITPNGELAFFRNLMPSDLLKKMYSFLERYTKRIPVLEFVHFLPSLHFKHIVPPFRQWLAPYRTKIPDQVRFQLVEELHSPLEHISAGTTRPRSIKPIF